MKKLFIAASVTVLLFSFAACKKAEEQKAPASSVSQGPIIDTGPVGDHGAPGQKTEFQISVPQEVKDNWFGVLIEVEDKLENTKEEISANIGSEFTIPGSELTVKVGPFLPDFKMNAQIITSASNEANNPAVGIAVYEGEKKLFPTAGEWGWLYANFPAIHSFTHDRYALVLKAATKRDDAPSPH